MASNQIQQVATEDAKQFIDNLDLTKVLHRLVKIDKWRKEEAIEAVKQYRNFLYLKYKYPDEQLPPSLEIDEAWHAHILHTKNYMDFCHRFFGRYFHHRPEPPEESQEPKMDTAKWFERTQALYLKEFGTYIYQVRKSFLQHLVADVCNYLFKKPVSFALHSLHLKKTV